MHITTSSFQTGPDCIPGKFSVDGVKKLSAKEGESVILQTEMTDIPEEDEIEWMFQDAALVKTDRQNKKIIYNKDDLASEERLHLDTKSGDLTVKNISTEVSGLYKVKIIKSTYTLQKTFNVTLKGECFKSFKARSLDVCFVNNVMVK